MSKLTAGRIPAEDRSGFLRRSYKHRRVPCTSRMNGNLEVNSSHFLNLSNNFFNREALAITQVKYITLRSASQMLYGKHMRISQIAHMNVITDAGTIRGRIVLAEDGNLLALT
ncbi:hypothetical protein D3C87_1633490 [compost metagenome]